MERAMRVDRSACAAESCRRARGGWRERSCGGQDELVAAIEGGDEARADALKGEFRELLTEVKFEMLYIYTHRKSL